MKNERGTSIIVTIVVFIISIAVAMQARTIFFANEDEEGIFEQTKRELQESTAYTNELNALANQLRNEYEARINALGDDELETRIKELHAQLNQINIIAGLTDVTGNGVVISLNDRSKDDVESWEINQSDLIVHSRYVYTLINELKIAGAQAIAVNGERIIPTSEIFCSGGNIKINGNMYVPPYIISAIGEPDALYRALTDSDIYFEINSNRLKFSITRESGLIIPKYKGNVEEKISGLSELKEEVKTNEHQYE